MIAAVGRQCTRCRQYKAAHEFDRASNRVGLSVRCKACRLEMGVTAHCKRCGEVYVVKGDRVGFCSSKCWYEFKSNRVQVPCNSCGKILVRGPEHVNGARLAFCSQGCQGDARHDQAKERNRCPSCGDYCRYNPKKGWNETCGRRKCIIITRGQQWYGDDPWAIAIAQGMTRLKDKPVKSEWDRRLQSAASSLQKRAAGMPKANESELRSLLERQEHRCAITGVELSPRGNVVDHIQPRSRGGSDTIDNLQFVTPEANKMKGEMNNEELID